MVIMSANDEPLKSQEIITTNPRMKNLLQIVQKIAPVNVPVLIIGESGTGKELFAREIHRQSKRAHKPLVIVNCAAIPRELVESELFGHLKGAFTGATESRPGKFELVDGGTIFLDEIGDLHLDAQAKLLRVLAEGEIQKVGTSRQTKVNVRLIAATNKDLSSDIKRGYFRSDLFYRLNVMLLKLPPLRERREDIGILAGYFLNHLCQTLQRPPVQVAAETLDHLSNYHWEGNIRQLRNTIERMLLLSDDPVLSTRHLPEEIRHNTSSGSPIIGQTLAEQIERIVSQAERSIIEDALFRHNGNISSVARELDVTRQTLYRKMDKYDIQTRYSRVP